jgi:hypothetical protein
MAWSDFYMQTTGSNLNAGSTSSDAAVYTSTAGNWDGTSVFTPTDGQTTTSLVNVNDWCSIYPTGNSTTPYIAQVTAVGAGTNGTITLSTTNKFGSAPSSNSGSRNAKTGGAWADLGMVASGVALNTGTVPLSTRINVKAGTYANMSTSRTFTLAGAATTPLWWRGYKTSIGDQDANNQAVAGTDIPTFTGTSGVFTISGINQNFHNIDWTCTSTGAPVITVGAVLVTFYGCRITATGANAASYACQINSGNAFFVRCWLKATASATRVMFCNSSTYTAFRACTVTGGIQGIEGSACLPLIIMNCVFDTQAGDAIKNSSGTWAIGNSIYNPAGHGINLTTISSSGNFLCNNYISGASQAGKFGITNSSGTNSMSMRLLGNAFFNCTGNINGATENLFLQDNGTLGSEAFQTPGSQDFRIKVVGQAIGNPGTFENVSVYQGYEDVGAMQHLATGGPTGQIMRVSGQHYQAN